MNEPDTELGGSRGEFPHTHSSAIMAARSGDERVRQVAFETLVRGYWKPVYKHLRFKWKASSDEAKDLTQAFFTHLLEHKHVQRYDPSKAAFRTYLRMCLDSFASNERKAAKRMKRGGNVFVMQLDFENAEAELQGQPLVVSEEEVFGKEWLRTLFGAALDAFRESCSAPDHQIRFALFERYDVAGATEISRPTYENLASEFGLTVTKVTNDLAWARREFRRHVLAKLRDLAGNDDEFREEARWIFGMEPT